MTTQTLSPDFKVPIPEYYQDYVNQLQGENFLHVLRQQLSDTTSFIKRIPDDKADFAYAPGKWTVKEVLIHLMDGERVFSYRALRFARNDQTELPGFEENDYAPASEAKRRTLTSIAEEYQALRQSTIALFSNFSDDQLNRIGIANGKRFSVILLGTIIAGHERHHRGVLAKRYGIS